MCLCTVYIPGALRSQKCALDLLGLELQMVIRPYEGAEIESESSGRTFSALHL